MPLSPARRHHIRRYRELLAEAVDDHARASDRLQSLCLRCDMGGDHEPRADEFDEVLQWLTAAKTRRAALSQMLTVLRNGSLPIENED